MIKTRFVLLSAFATLAAACAVPKTASAQIYTPQWKVGGAAQKKNAKVQIPGTLKGNLHGLVLDGKENIYVADEYSVQKFDKNGKFLLKFGSEGTGNGQFKWGIGGMAADKNGNVYLSDWGSSRVQKFRSDGTFLSTFGTPGAGNGQFKQTGALAVDKSGNLYVADGKGYYDYRIQKFDASGRLLTTYNRYNNRATSLAVDSKGNLWTVGIPFRGNPNIQKISPKGAVSTLATASKNISDEGGTHLTLDASDNLYVLDGQRCRVHIYNSKGVLISRFSAPDKVGLMPEGIAADNKSDVYLAATGSDGGYVRKFRRRYLAP